MAAHPTFTHQRGEVLRWRNGGRDFEALSRAQIEALRAEYSAETRTAYRAGKRQEAMRLAGLWLELTTAADELSAFERGATLGFESRADGYVICLGREEVAHVETFDAGRAVMAAAREANAMLAACLAMAPGGTR